MIECILYEFPQFIIISQVQQLFRNGLKCEIIISTIKFEHTGNGFVISRPAEHRETVVVVSIFCKWAINQTSMASFSSSRVEKNLLVAADENGSNSLFSKCKMSTFQKTWDTLQDSSERAWSEMLWSHRCFSLLSLQREFATALPPSGKLCLLSSDSCGLD